LKTAFWKAEKVKAEKVSGTDLVIYASWFEKREAEKVEAEKVSGTDLVI